jgi:hypothetical protein
VQSSTRLRGHDPVEFSQESELTSPVAGWRNYDAAI